MEQNSKNERGQKPVVGITLGDLNGIGPEVVVKALADNRILNHITPVIYGSTKALSFYRKIMKIDDFNYSQVKTVNNAHPKRINVLNCWSEMVEIKPGVVTEEGGKYAFKSLEMAVKHLKEEQIDAIVTAPINKKNIQSDKFNFIGHTEYLTKELGAEDSLMMMVAEELRVGVVTAHIPLNVVSKNINKGMLESKLKILINTLKNDFGIDKPKIALLGLNPHAGEEGLLGQEELDVISPLMTELKKKGHLLFGPFPADGFFGNGEYKKYDGILAMYHDQGLVPFKLLSFERGVNYTAGLKRIRTSPDHGTAFGIAGKNVADPTSMREAIFLAADIARQRMEKAEIVKS